MMTITMFASTAAACSIASLFVPCHTTLHAQGRPDLSLSILLQLRAADVFEFIEAHSLVGGCVNGRVSGTEDAAASKREGDRWVYEHYLLRLLLFCVGSCVETEAAAVPGCVAGVWASAAQGTVNGSVGAGC